MRDIIFRGKRIDNEEWVHGRFSYGNKYGAMFIEPVIVAREYGAHSGDIVTATYPIMIDTLGQYTGLADKNGRKIFEGDIVKHFYELLIPGGGTGVDRGVIKWDCEECFFFRTSDDGKDRTISAKCVYEVIGNIYDNPELVTWEARET